jgi:hypothetical protein
VCFFVETEKALENEATMPWNVDGRKTKNPESFMIKGVQGFLFL